MKNNQPGGTAVGAAGERQYIISLPHRAAFGREDFIVGACNEQAVTMIDRWPEWPHRVFSMIGPAGSGKSHLARVWQKLCDGRVIPAADLTVDGVPNLLSRHALVVEDGDSLRDEAALFHLLNLVAQEDAWLLVTSVTPLAHWPIQDAGLSSRLSSVPSVSLEAPSDDVLAGVLEKLFRDRQLDVSRDLAPYLVTRMERSFDAAQRVVDKLDRVSLARQQRISKRLASEVLDQIML
ncbi:MAG: hypothetical protein E2O89_01510 [Alphaproteobacteria bacterium]|nr:MAG: hypothetical protein E2O89_01510 [Alphaproteobacteria bacterium]